MRALGGVWMRRVVWAAGLVVWAAGLSEAQVVVTPGAWLAWDQPAGALGEAQGYAYDAVLDGGASVTLAGVVCTGGSSPYLCAAPVPVVAVGAHTVAVGARNAAGASPLSAVLNFVFVALPSAPRNLRFTLPGA